MARRTKADAMKTRKAILETALDVFIEKGYKLATFDDIARRINMTKGAIYWHFKSKIDLLKEILIEEHNTNGDLFSWEPKPDGSPYSLDDIREHFCSCAKAILANPAKERFFLFAGFRIEWSPVLRESLREAFKEEKLPDPKESFAQALRILQQDGAIKQDADIEGIVLIVMSIFSGVLKHVLTMNRSLDGVRLVNNGIAAIFDALKV